jgi:hypothetical protein
LNASDGLFESGLGCFIGFHGASSLYIMQDLSSYLEATWHQGCLLTNYDMKRKIEKMIVQFWYGSV